MPMFIFVKLDNTLIVSFAHKKSKNKHTHTGEKKVYWWSSLVNVMHKASFNLIGWKQNFSWKQSGTAMTLRYDQSSKNRMNR